MSARSLKSVSLILFILISVSLTACDYAPPLGGKWVFDADSLNEPIIKKSSGWENDPFIPCAVIGYAHNDQFIIAAQKPGAECANATDRSKTGNPLNFWIIDVGADKVIGPLSINEYYQKRQQLNIPEDLKMDVSL